MSNGLVGCYYPLGVFISSCASGFPFYLGPFIPCVVTAQELAAYSCFTTQSFWYSLNDLLAQLSARIRSVVVLLYSEFMRAFRSAPWTFQCWRTGFSLLWVLVPGFKFGKCLGFLGRIKRSTSRRGPIPCLIQRAWKWRAALKHVIRNPETETESRKGKQKRKRNTESNISDRKLKNFTLRNLVQSKENLS